MAGLMLSAILSDTLLLTSPTTTDSDRIAAIKLAKIAKVDMDNYGKQMLKAAIMNDFKIFNIDKKTIGISQIMTMDIEFIEDNKDKFISKMNKMCEREYYVVVIFVTDVIKNGSYVYYSSNAENIIRDSFGLKSAKEGTFLPKIVSRKKQMLPALLEVIEKRV